MYSDADVAALYDATNPWDPDRFPADRFYSELVLAAGSVLDVGCGTGSMLHHARDHGHRGRLTGVDPDPAMLARARARTDVEWVLGTAAEMRYEAEFELATMVSHAFQCLVTDDDVRASLAAVRRALEPGGRFVFETRNPQRREWESWEPANAADVRDAAGRALRMAHHVEDVAGDVVTLTETTSEGDTVLRVDRAQLRFLDVPALTGFLTAAGFTVEAQYGDWRRGPLTATSTEIVTVARPT